MNVNAIILASGLSRRMKQDKLKLKLHDRYIYEYILSTINNCSELFSEVIVVAKDKDILNKSNNFGFKAVINEISNLGQSASIKLGIQNSNKADGYMFFVADQPFVKVSTIEKLLKTFEENYDKIIRPFYNGMNGNPVIFPDMLKEQLLMLEGDTGGKFVIGNNLDILMKVHINTINEFIDIDTMEDYDRVNKKVKVE